MSYRVELALSNRSGCQGTECKNSGIKIDKDELRFGAWVEFQDRGSWTWRHWGCVTGKQLDNLRKYLEDPANPGVYRWDYLDGYDGPEKNSLAKHPEYQEKVRRVITQGFIDPEDFNGDPEMNKLGETGLRTTESKKRMREEQKNRTHEIAELKEKLAAVEAERDALLARGSSASKMEAQIGDVKAELEQAEEKKPVIKRVKAESDGKEDKKAPKKKAKTKAKKEEDSDEEEKPVKKARAKKGAKKEPESESDGEVIPVKKVRGKAVKKEEDVEMADGEGPTPPKKRAARGKKAVKEEPVDDQNGVEQSAEAPKPVAKRGRPGKAVKTEPLDENSIEDTTESPKEARAKRGRGKNAIKQEDEDTLMTDAPPAKKARGKKGIKEEIAGDTPMFDAPEPTAPLPDLEDYEGQIAKTEDAMRQVSEQEIEEGKGAADLAEKRGDPLPKTLSAEEVEIMQNVENEENIVPRKLSKGKKAAAPPRKGIDRRALSRGKTES